MTHFYKYASAETGRIVLENGTLRLSAPSVLNDPFDMQFALQLPADMGAVRAKTMEKLYRYYWGGRTKEPFAGGVWGAWVREPMEAKPRATFAEEIGPALDKTIENFIGARARFNNILVREQFANSRILCLSEIPDSIVMWSYYAGNHSGIVLRFTDEPPTSSFKEAKPVRYVDKMPALYDEDGLSDMLAGYGTLNPTMVLDDVVWTKSSHWAHEREWRIYGGAGETAAPYEDVEFDPGELDGVIFGMRMPDRDRSAIGDLLKVKYPHTELFQAQPKPDAYELVIGKWHP